MGKNRIQTIHIKKKSLAQLLTYYIFILPFLFGLLIDFVGLPGFVRYTIDVAWIAILLQTLRKQRVRFSKKLLPLVLLVVAFFLYTLLDYLLQYQSMVYYLWGFRNLFRVYVLFFAVVAFFDTQDVENCFRVMDSLFWVNVVITVIQFFVLGYKQDYLGGIFGVERGSNAYTIMFFSIAVSRSVLSMMNGSEKLMSCLLRCTATLILAVLAELYAFFLVFAVILVVATICTRFSWRKCLLYIVLTIVISVCSMYLVELFGEGSKLSLEVITRRLFSQNYATENDLGRLTAIPTISRKMLTNLQSRLFGLGLGNCDTSTFAICNTPFYESHASLHYTWFLSAFLFLETGYIGLAFYLGFFITCMILSIKGMKKRRQSRLLSTCSDYVSAVYDLHVL